MQNYDAKNRRKAIEAAGKLRNVDDMGSKTQELRGKLPLTQNLTEQQKKSVEQALNFISDLTQEERDTILFFSLPQILELFSVISPQEIQQGHVAVIRGLGGTYLANPQPIDEGGFGEVFKGFYLNTGKTVAFKALLPVFTSDPEKVKAFAAEARSHAQEDSHPNIVSIQSYLESPQSSNQIFANRPLLIMEYMSPANSRTLSNEVLEQSLQGSEFSPQIAIEIVTQICDALSYLALPKNRVAWFKQQVIKFALNEENISTLHLDLKPANVFLVRNNDGTITVKISDFGLASTAYNRDNASTIHGSPKYMSPEPIKRTKPDIRSELFTLVSIIYNLLTGEDFYDGTSSGTIPAPDNPLPILQEILRKQFTILPPELKDYCDRHNLDKRKVSAFFSQGWRKDINGRFKSPEELAAAFKDAFTPMHSSS